MPESEEANDQQAMIDRLTRQVTDLSARLGTAEGDRDGYRTKLRSTVHRQAFKDKALAARVDPKAVDDLWKLAGYEPEGDEPDDEAIDGLVKAAQEVRPYAFLKDEPPADEPKPPPRLKKPIDDGRGRPPASNPAKFQVTRRQLADGVWMRENQPRVREAQKAGTFELVD
jgi:hypothetical protein